MSRTIPWKLKMITEAKWKEKLEAVHMRKEDMNQVVMDFFLTQGYTEAAKQFERESGTKPNMDLDDVRSRVAIRNAVHSGSVDEGIEKVNDMNPDILESNQQLSFDLQQQHVIELIRDGKVYEALHCAKENLAPYCTDSDDTFFKELEKTVVLLAFKDPVASPVGDLLDLKKREQAAKEIDQAVLVSQGYGPDSKLHYLLKLLIWAQTQLGEKASFPRIDNLTYALFEHEGTSPPRTI